MKKNLKTFKNHNKTVLTVIFICFTTFFQGCKSSSTAYDESVSDNIIKELTNTLLDNWHKAAANASFESYFSLMDQNAIFIGTDAAEHWTKEEFKTYSKPYFDKGKAWSFTTIDRHIFISKDKKIVWFDELLNTQMGICRGSGVLTLGNDTWKITHYTLSMTIPNKLVEDVVSLKKEKDTILLKQILSD
ncbi:nuclear transport factor 2 family protein [Mangrovimonas aestuarii]|uniref:nuclear transport factor 2 family protein n=1 Tax=Mangrovimonas aestuarii TaxID=3018443 RepID=UPI002377DE42|nr:nuclear transport factor 2 family protein [Mangrovimonas aestuarii]